MNNFSIAFRFLLCQIDALVLLSFSMLDFGNALQIYMYGSSTDRLSGFTDSIKKHCGFTGSCAGLIIEKEEPTLFVDPRYTLQAHQECSCKIVEVPCVSLEHIIPHISDSFETIFYNPLGLTIQQYQQLQKAFPTAHFHPLTEKAEIPFVSVCEYIRGQKAEDKLNEIRTKFPDLNWGYLITSPEAIAWIFNLRRQHIHNCSPTFPCAALITLNQAFIWTYWKARPETSLFIPEESDDFASLPEKIAQKVAELNLQTLFLNESQTPIAYLQNLQQTLKPEPCHDIVALPRSIKAHSEIESAKRIQMEEALAIIHLLKWIEEFKDFTEWDIVQKLESLRKISPLYLGPSFPSIVASGKNAAIVHYEPTASSFSKIEPNVLLIDVGGHYLGGTTDMTRTLWMGSSLPSPEIKEAYTCVLKGHIALASAVFPKNTTGGQLDILARQFLWQKGMDYHHGTGHGIGNCLAVHEGPQSLSAKSSVPLTENMLLTDEPGYYKENNFGIHLENVLQIVPSLFPDFLKFMPLTLIPFEPKLIDFQSLTISEKAWLRWYHKKMIKHLAFKLTSEECQWLTEKIAPFINLA